MAEVSYYGMDSEEVSFGVKVQPNESWKLWIVNRKRQFALVSVVVVIAIACTITLCLTLQNARTVDYHETQKEKLLKYLCGLDNDKTISGVEFDEFEQTYLEDIVKITKAQPGVVGINIPSHYANNDKWTSFVESVISVWNLHYLVEISWIKHQFTKAQMCFHLGYDSIEKNWYELTLEGSLSNTWLKQQLDVIGPNLQKLQTAGVVPILDILGAINYKPNSYWTWSGQPGVNGSSKLYKMTQDYLKQSYNLTSIIWTWSLHSLNLTQFEEYWPGSEFVDVVSVYMEDRKELTINEYQRLVNLIGDTPMSMKWMHYIPTTELLATQLLWTWFSVTVPYIRYYSINHVQATYNSPSVINRGSITYFENTN